MKTSIRQGTEKDLVQIAWHLKRPVELIKWLFSNEGNGNAMSLLVLSDEEDTIHGFIGYTLSEYRYNDQVFKGVIPMSWYIAPEFRGINGSQLLLKTMQMGEFGFAIGGSLIAQNTYRVAKLEKQFTAGIYYKMLKPFGYFLSGRDRLVNTISKMFFCLPGYFLSRKKNDPSYSFKTFEGMTAGKNEKAVNLMYHVENKDRIEWLLSCPCVSSYAFSIWKDQSHLGTLVLYMAVVRNQLRGKIVHVPYLGKEKDAWLNVLQFSEDFMKSKGCTFFSVFAGNGDFIQALKHKKYIRSRSQNKSVFLRDQNEVLKNVNLKDWHVTYYESDKAYRNF